VSPLGVRCTTVTTVALFLFCFLSAACGTSGPPAAGRRAAVDRCIDRSDGWLCLEDDALLCEGGLTDEQENCASSGEMCVTNLGCLTCLPNTRTCQGQDVVECKKSGAGYKVVETCAAELQCSQVGCADLCKQAADNRSYIGCEYWPVTTANGSLDPGFEPAIVVANPQLIGVKVTLALGGKKIQEVSIPAGGIETLAMPFVDLLRSPFLEERAEDGSRVIRSTLVRGGGYRLTSTAPVTAHQYNPLEFALDPCKKADSRDCFSFTNDASLLLPTTALTGNYVVITQPTNSTFLRAIPREAAKARWMSSRPSHRASSPS
jgi:hypothetical protein